MELSRAANRKIPSTKHEMCLTCPNAVKRQHRAHAHGAGSPDELAEG